SNDSPPRWPPLPVVPEGALDGARAERRSSEQAPGVCQIFCPIVHYCANKAKHSSSIMARISTDFRIWALFAIDRSAIVAVGALDVAKLRRQFLPQIPILGFHCQVAQLV